MTAFSGIVRSPVYLQVAEQIRDAILAGQLAPGASLPTERELSSQFGVSRTTVREALRILQQQGLISGGGRTRTQRTTVSTEPPHGALREAFQNLVQLRQISLSDLVELRCVLESTSVSRAAQHEDRANRLGDARTALKEMTAPGLSVEEFQAEDVRFHVALSSASGNQAIHLIMLAVRHSIESYLLAHLLAIPDAGPTIRGLTEQHLAILEAIESGNDQHASALVRKHIMDFYRQSLERTADDQ